MYHSHSSKSWDVNKVCDAIWACLNLRMSPNPLVHHYFPHYLMVITWGRPPTIIGQTRMTNEENDIYIYIVYNVYVYIYIYT